MNFISSFCKRIYNHNAIPSLICVWILGLFFGAFLCVYCWKQVSIDSVLIASDDASVLCIVLSSFFAVFTVATLLLVGSIVAIFAFSFLYAGILMFSAVYSAMMYHSAGWLVSLILFGRCFLVGCIVLFLLIFYLRKHGSVSFFGFLISILLTIMVSLMDYYFASPMVDYFIFL